MYELKTKYNPFYEVHHGDFFKTNRWIFKFENGYGASVVCHTCEGKICTFGNKNAPFELAVILFDGDKYSLCYNTPIADEVIGYLTNEEVEKYLEEIERYVD